MISLGRTQKLKSVPQSAGRTAWSAPALRSCRTLLFPNAHTARVRMSKNECARFWIPKKETATLQSPFPCAVSGAAGAYRTTNTTAVRGGTVKRPLTRS